MIEAMNMLILVMEQLPYRVVHFVQYVIVLRSHITYNEMVVFATSVQFYMQHCLLKSVAGVLKKIQMKQAQNCTTIFGPLHVVLIKLNSYNYSY